MTKPGSTNRLFIFTNIFQTLKLLGGGVEASQNKSPQCFLAWKMSKGILIHEYNKSLLGKLTPERLESIITFPCCEKTLPKFTGQNTGHGSQHRDACP